MKREPYKHVNHPNVETEAGLLWEACKEYTQIDDFRPCIRPHPRSLLFGYCDITLTVACFVTQKNSEGVEQFVPGVYLPIKLRGIEVKFLKGKPHLNMPAEQGSDKEWYEHFMNRSHAGRLYLTMFIFNDQEVQDTIAEAATQVTAAATAAAATNSSEAPTGTLNGPELAVGNPFKGLGEDGQPITTTPTPAASPAAAAVELPLPTPSPRPGRPALEIEI